MSAWVSLPAGSSVEIRAGYRYSIVALVKNSHSSASIEALLARDALTVNSYFDPAPASRSTSNPQAGYRFIMLDVTATKDAGSIPWKVPSPLSIFDDTTMTVAYAEPASAGLPPASSLAKPAHSKWPAILGAAAIVGGGWWMLHRLHSRG